MNFNYYYGDDFGAPQQFRIYQLGDTLQISGQKSKQDIESEFGEEQQDTAVYYDIYDEISVEGQISNDESIIINPTDTIPDFISLENDFGYELLNLVSNQDLTPLEIYNTLKGFKLEVDPGKNNLQGLSLASEDSYIEVVYQSPSADTLQSVFFDLSRSSFTHVDFQPGSLIPSSYSGNNSFDLSNPSKAYFNNLLGISPRFNLDPYLSFIDSVDYMQINKAEITISNQDFNIMDTPNEQIRPIQNIVPYILEGDEKFKKQGKDFWAIQSNFNSNGAISNQNAGTSPMNLSYDDVKKSLRGDISFFLQEIYNDPSFWVSGGEEENSIIFTGQFIRVNDDAFREKPIINTGNFDNFLVDKENIKLKIYYTTFK